MRKMNANLMGPACMQLDIHQMNITKRLDNLVAGMSILATFCYLSGNNGVFITRNGGYDIPLAFQLTLALYQCKVTFLNRLSLKLLIQASMGIAMFGKKHDPTGILV